MSTIDIGIGDPVVPIRAPSVITPKPSAAAVVAAKPAPQDEDAFYIGSVKIETGTHPLSPPPLSTLARAERGA
jgi:hypothetical protein